MKKIYYFLSVAVMLAVASMTQTVKAEMVNGLWVAPEFDESEWTYVGIGIYHPGIWSCFDTEYPFDLDAKVWKSKTVEGEYWIEPDGSEVDTEATDEGPGWFAVPGPFILHAQNPDEVWTDPIWSMHSMLFCQVPQVPAFLGAMGSAANYGKMVDKHVTFPANSYKMSGQGFTYMGNANGKFAITLPDESGIAEVAADNAKAEYYTLQGIKVQAPAAGNVYIVKTGNKAKKVIF